MGRRTETLLLQAHGTFAQELHLAIEARIFHVEMQRREHDEDAHEERDGHIDQVAVVTRKAFAHEDVARKEQPQETRLAAALHAGGALLLGTLLLLGLAVGTQVVGGLAALLASIVKEKTGAKVRGIELSLLQRCGAHLASETDIEEAVMAGRAAVENAVAVITDKMVAFERETVDGHFVCKTKLLPLTSVANFYKKIPLEWINDSHNGVKQELIDYVLPLIQGEPKLPKEDYHPPFAKHKKKKAK